MGHILQLPSAPNIPIFYGSVLSGLCKQKPTVFPVIVSSHTLHIHAHTATHHHYAPSLPVCTFCKHFLYTLPVCTFCKHFLYTLPVCTFCKHFLIHFLYALSVSTSCIHFLYALLVCISCMHFLYVLHVCTSCMHVFGQLLGHNYNRCRRCSQEVKTGNIHRIDQEVHIRSVRT